MRQQLLNINEASAIAGLSIRQLYRLAQSGAVPSFKRGRHTSRWLFPSGLLHNWFISRTFRNMKKHINHSALRQVGFVHN